jgi:hypothetical protein
MICAILSIDIGFAISLISFGAFVIEESASYQVTRLSPTCTLPSVDLGASSEVSMKLTYLVPLTLSMLSVVCFGQCTSSEMSPTWEADKQQFKCVASGGSGAASHDEIVSPKGDKAFCTNARENLMKACPDSNGKACKNKAKSIFNDCYKASKAQSESQAGSATNANQTIKTDPAVCMQTFTQQQQACQARRTPPPASGQPSAPDTCLQDGMTAQNKCLANSR